MGRERSCEAMVGACRAGMRARAVLFMQAWLSNPLRDSLQDSR